MTRNESQLTVRQSTAVNPHVVPLVAAKIQLLPSKQQWRRDDWSLTEDDLPRSSGRPQHLKWCGPDSSRINQAITPECIASCLRLEQGFALSAISKEHSAQALCLARRHNSCLISLVPNEVAPLPN